MRLGTCIALELVVAAGAVGGAAFGVAQAISQAGDYLTTREASASTLVDRRASTIATAGGAIEPLGASRLPVTPVVELPPNNIFGARDEELLAPIGGARVTRMKLNHGGTSLSIRIDFANGARAAFKPEQRFPQSDPRREIAAFRIDRLLGLGHVPPAKEVTVPVKELIDGSEAGFRAYVVGRLTDDAEIRRGNVLHGEASWWIPEIRLAALGPYRIDEKIGREIWTRQLQVGASINPAYRRLLEQISTMLVFDIVIDNADRWSGGNTMMSPDAKQLYFMDNSLSFSLARFGHPMNATALRRIQVFSRRLVKRLRELTADEIAAALAMPPASKLGPLIDRDEQAAILVRRDNLLRYVDSLIARFGEDAVLAFP